MNKYSSIIDLQESNISALAQIRFEIENLFVRYGAQPSDTTITLKRLFWYLGARSQAVSFLVSFGYTWDAEIILRSVYETAAKILFICFADNDEKIVLVNEFWADFGPINDRRTARKAVFAEKIFENGGVSASIFGMLQDDRIFDLEAEVSKTERKRLEHKWSFSEIIESLDRRVIAGNPLQGIKSFLHMYGIASHLIHADKNAMDLMYDRATREAEERKILEESHTARIMSDQVSLSLLCAGALRQHFRGHFSDAAKLYEAFERTCEFGKTFTTAFEDSQRAFYSRWLRDKLPDKGEESG